MIEIKCNHAQKNKIINALRTSDSPCLFPKSQARCAYDKDMDCVKCLETKIKWRIPNDTKNNKPQQKGDRTC